MLQSQLESLNRLDFEFAGPLGRCASCPWDPSVIMYDVVEARGVKFHVDDIVFRADEAGCIVACFREASGRWSLCVESLVLLASVSPASASWRQTSTRVLWLACECDLAHAWRQDADRSLRVICL